MTHHKIENRISIAIGIATAGRVEVVSELIRYLGKQEILADELLICPAAASDIDPNALAEYEGLKRVVRSSKGLPAQRNAILAASKADILVFLDDDFLPAFDFLTEAQALFLSDQSLVVATGKVLADGILGPGLSFEEGISVLSTSVDENLKSELEDTHNAYGCNMVIRTVTAKNNNVTFDEYLPLYAWLEDVDFSRQLAPFGRIVKSSRLRGVHLGTKRSGRSPGRRLGYSQIANPIYLARKKTLTWRRALAQIFRNVAANLFRSFTPEPWVDRRGRLKGNLLGMSELLKGQLSPRRVLDI